MGLPQVILKELWHRKLNWFLSALALTGTVAMFVAFLTTSKACQRETIRVSRDMGFNLRIVPKATDMDLFWTTGYSEVTMPEETVAKLAAYESVFASFNHLVASLQRKIPLDGKEVLLTGLAPAVTAPGQSRQPMGFSIKPGTVHLGAEVARRLGLKKGDALELAGGTFLVERSLVETGTDDDIRIFGLLSDVQLILGEPGRINEIKAIDCLCLTADEDPLSILRSELAKALPEAKVIQIRSLADARARQRRLIESYFALATPVLLVASAAWVGLLAVVNVRERRMEIGILRALGKRSREIAALFLGKAFLTGLLGAAVGFVLGTTLALYAGPGIFLVTATAIKADWNLLGWALVGTPLFAALAAFIPAMMAVSQDPAEILRED
jgi:putative ABC transport system permease protein